MAADSEDFRSKRLKHDEHLSRVFDEVMGLGDFADSSADSSRGSVNSPKSGDQDETKEAEETPGKGETEPVEEEEEENSNSSRQEEPMDEGTEESSLPRLVPSPTPDQPSSFPIGLSGGEGRRSGGAACDDAQDGLPSFGVEEEDEDWHFALPMGTLEDVEVGKAKRKRQLEVKNMAMQVNAFAKEPKGPEEAEQEGSSGSANTSHSSRDNTPENSRDGAPLTQAEETEDSQQGEVGVSKRSARAPTEDSNLPLSPSVKIKDEPIDEGYEAAMLPQTSSKHIKEELEQEEELRISSVYSVGGASTFVSPPAQVPAAAAAAAAAAAVPAPAPAATAIFIPGRGAVLQAMAPLSVRPPAPPPTSLQALGTVPPRPPHPPVAGSVRCSGCSKVLLKGQTAFQRKGSTQLFCSTVCLTGHLPPSCKTRCCFQCNREIMQPKDMIAIPLDDHTYMHFCGQFCLSLFRHKKKQVDKKKPEKWPEKLEEKKPEKQPEKPVPRPPEKPCCSVCRVTNRPIEHEVTHQGRLHRLCSDACFQTWRKMRQLAMNCCEGCGLYCNSKSGSCHTLSIEKTQLNFCSPTCIGTYKQTSKKMTDCANCHKMVPVSTTTMELDLKGKVQLYCSLTCVEQTRPSPHMLSGTAFPCCQCKVSAVPQYHLAMVDGTIRNFCSYDCVSTYRKMGPPPDVTNGPTSLRAPRPGPSAGAGPVPHPGHHPSHTSVPPLVPPPQTQSSPSAPGQLQAKAASLKPAEAGAQDASRLTCHQCSKHFSTKPLLFSQHGRISMFCSKACSEQYKTQKNILGFCEYCKVDKVIYEVINYNQQDVTFCSENCKLLFKHDLTSRNKDHEWNPCTYCNGIRQKMLRSHYGGRMEAFCRPHCMSQYTVLYYGMGRCDSCRKQSYMTEKLQCLGSARNFCAMPCLLQYCLLHFETNQRVNSNGTDGGAAPVTPYAPAQPYHSSKMNPVIADIVSLANGSATQPNLSADGALTGAVPTLTRDGKNLDHASTQTDSMRVPMPRRRQMKNKSVLCRPFTMDQETLCKPPTASTQTADLSQLSESSSSGGERVKVIMVPIPVPVFIPVPMNMFSQHTPVPMAMPVPLPVPILIPPQEKEVKDAAVQSEPSAVKEAKLDLPVSYADQGSSSSGVTQSEVSPRSISQEKGTPIEGGVLGPDPPAAAGGSTEPTGPAAITHTEGSTGSPEGHQVTAQTEESRGQEEEPPPSREEPQAPSSPMMDLESDFPLEWLDQKASTPQRGVKRPREGSSGRKRGRRRTVSVDRGAVTPPSQSKLIHLYGVSAWRSWVQQHNRQPHDSSSVCYKEDVLQCDSAELSFALSRFIREVRRPNGETYSPDSIFYLCLGIQQHLFIKGRIENIFTDELYSQFATEISGMLQHWKPKLLPAGGAVSSRVEESYLWECKQLGAYSPIVLLNTLLFFCTKNFGFTTPAQHQNLGFSDFVRHVKACTRTGKVHYLRYQRSKLRQDVSERIRRRQEEDKGDMEIPENTTNPLHCPVRLYEFYLSRCPETAKKRTDVFYLQPEKNVHTHSPHWYTSQPLERSTLQSMLTRILAVREVPREVPQQTTRRQAVASSSLAATEKK
ncbi:zinc finger MYM-type protein 4-like [Genypterus blacodes]|uniref:zinc finger MYM-type protein 4-like n=1 Tax=Genypterus blacodes TaxID=154954 RepID=UPI003F76B5B1